MSRARKKVLTVVGARPQFVKAFALSRALGADSGFEEVLLHTGQHFDGNMSDIFFRELEIPAPKYQFSIAGTSHADMTAEMLKAIEGVLREERPRAVIVYGDTNSTLAGALAAAKLGIELVHVEAGLRSFNRAMPEEINRVVADHVSTILFCPTRGAVENLAREGISRNVHLTGDLMFDATLLATPLAERKSTILAALGLAAGGYGLATLHRAGNTDERETLAHIIDYIAREATRQPIVFPLHPRTRRAAERLGIALARPGLRIIEPVGYLDMCRLLHHAAIVLTDSGGVQKEAYFHRVPCVTLRGETEWTETVECGWNRLWTEPGYRPRREIREYGDGKSAEAMVTILRTALA